MPYLQQNVSLFPYNTFGMDVQAQWWLGIEDPIDLIAFLADNDFQTMPPILTIGGGSNLLFIKDFEGLVLKNNVLGKEVVQEDEQYVYLRIGGGENWHSLVEYCIAQNWGGIENLSLIPGCVGAAPIQNIGAYGVELEQVFHSLEAIHLLTANQHLFDHAACQFGYRDSIFKREAKGLFFISHVTLRLTKNPQLQTSYGMIKAELGKLNLDNPTIADVSQVICAIRQQKLPDPKKIGNAGSFFKNPVISAAQFSLLQAQYPAIPHYPQAAGTIKIPAAWLIQQAGWKGKRLGNYGVHPNQALVLVNYGGASGQALYELSSQILQSVHVHFSITLEREVNVVGL